MHFSSDDIEGFLWSDQHVSVILLLSKVVKVSTEELFPANPDILEGVEDLIQLSYLNEPSVLYNLRVRYTQDVIYVSLLKILQLF